MTLNDSSLFGLIDFSNFILPCKQLENRLVVFNVAVFTDIFETDFLHISFWKESVVCAL